MQSGGPGCDGPKKKNRVEKNREDEKKGIILIIAFNMVKFIPTLERTLNARIDRLTADFEQIQAENERLRAENARLSRMAYGRRGSVRAAREATDSPSASTNGPSYLRPTLASQAHVKQHEKGSHKDPGDQEDDRSPFYEDGKLVRTMKFSARPHYMSCTSASLSKSKNPSASWAHLPEQGESLLEFSCEEEVHSPSIETPPSSIETTHSYLCLSSNPVDRCLNDPAPNSLASLTQLNDNSWHGPFDAELYVPCRIQSRLLNSAHRIAQDVMFKAGRVHWPATQDLYWAGGPREVKLGRGELTDTLGRHILINANNNNSTSRPWDVTSFIYATTALRNAVCHPGALDSEDTDSLLKKVHRLAVVFQDSEGAKKVRKLRDELRAETRKVHADIENIYALRADPTCRRQWKAHHLNVFFNILRDDDGDSSYGRANIAKYSLAVRCAAWDWDFARKSRAPARGDFEMGIWVGEVRSFARLTSAGCRHNSFSGVASEVMYDREEMRKLTEVETDWSAKDWSDDEKLMVRQLGLVESFASREKRTSSDWGFTTSSAW